MFAPWSPGHRQRMVKSKGPTGELKTPALGERGVQLADPYRHTHRRQSADPRPTAWVASNMPSPLEDKIGPVSFRAGYWGQARWRGTWTQILGGCSWKPWENDNTPCVRSTADHKYGERVLAARVSSPRCIPRVAQTMGRCCWSQSLNIRRRLIWTS